MKTRTDPSATLRQSLLTLPDGRTLGVGDEFAVRNTPTSDGRYAFRYGWPSKAGEATELLDITCYGPLGRKSEDPKVRTFRPDQITTIHRKKIERVTQ